jgi:hypothetical protein
MEEREVLFFILSRTPQYLLLKDFAWPVHLATNIGRVTQGQRNVFRVKDLEKRSGGLP